MSIHPTAIIEDGVQLGAGCVVQAHAIIRRHTVLGDGVVVHPFAVVGGDPELQRIIHFALEPTHPRTLRFPVGAPTTGGRQRC